MMVKEVRKAIAMDLELTEGLWMVSEGIKTLDERAYVKVIAIYGFWTRLSRIQPVSVSRGWGLLRTATQLHVQRNMCSV